ncbi:MAG: FAD-dependent oxidoreductase, partial [Gammaproteobacteria bacterium]|nr:FAD-dependent oxidoreductase [Gammaproteobacteria bacterium]
MHVIVCGAGVIGAAIAYYLSARGVTVSVVERTGVACAASGKSGGFLARDWCDGTPQESLARLSFDLHDDLPRSLGADYGYRRVETFQVAAGDGGDVDRYRRFPSPGWLDGNCAVYARIGTPENTAQIHPELFTRTLMDCAQRQGAVLRTGCVNGLEMRQDRVTGVRVDDEVLTADAAVIAMGPWSILAAAWLPLPAVGGLKSHSITIRPSAPVPAHALFVEFVSGAAGESPEVVPRADGEVYLCGISDDLPLPSDPLEVVVNESSCERLHDLAGRLSRILGRGKVTRTQACYRPICADAMPVMGRVPGVDGAFVATGHNCWGM